MKRCSDLRVVTYAQAEAELKAVFHTDDCRICRSLNRRIRFDNPGYTQYIHGAYGVRGKIVMILLQI